MLIAASCLVNSAAVATDNPKLVAVKISAVPNLDGEADEPTWKSGQPVEIVARGVMPKTRGTSSIVTLRPASCAMA
jgi:hypothetical protein